MSILLTVFAVWFFCSIPISLIVGRFLAMGKTEDELAAEAQGYEQYMDVA